ncbi:MAG: hypothetical protein NC328_08195 [Muribaculum sp.]|nr:hypothetical protein [Muribaculum sp.]
MRNWNKIFKGVTFLCCAGIYASTAFGITPTSPSAPLNFKVEPDETGVMKVYISFNAPEKTVGGDVLSAIDRIELKRDNQLVTTYRTVSPGQLLSYTDTQVSTGYSTYTVTAYTSEEGETASSNRIFVGVDEPLAPTKFTVKDDGSQLMFTWAKSAKVGKNGERVNQNTVKYVVEELNDSYEPVKELTETASQATYVFLNTNTGDQDLRRFSIYAKNSAGESERVYLVMVTGAPYYLPYSESFAAGVLHGLGWQSGDGDVVLTTDDSADGDFGCLMLTPPAKGTFSFNLGKIDVTRVANPRITFSYKGLGEGEKMLLRLGRPDGAEGTLATLEGPIEDWTSFTVDITKATKNNRYLIPKLQLLEGNTQTVLIDDIRIYDPYENDLSVFVKAPSTTSDEITAQLIVTNEGINPSHDAKVVFSVDRNVQKTFDVKDGLAPGESQTIETRFNAPEGALGNSVEISAEIQWAYDLNPLNDKATAEILYNGSDDSRGEMAGVSVLEDIDLTSAAVYSLDGRKMKSACGLAPGIYIINGKKVIIK